MMEWLTNLFMSIAGRITSWFMDPDALKFDIVTMIIVVVLFTLLVLIIAFWSTIMNWFKGKRK